MKNTFFIIITAFIIVFGLVFGLITSEKNKKREVANINSYYEKYLNKEIPGTELATIMGKANEQNIKNEIKKDENGMFIENNTNSIKIYIKMVTIDKTFSMETIYNRDISQFVENFNFVNFRCIEIKYHKSTGLISEITFEEIEEDQYL